jgi:hypothetical protein
MCTKSNMLIVNMTVKNWLQAIILLITFLQNMWKCVQLVIQFEIMTLPKLK